MFYIRDKEKREVDFLVSKNNKPWLLIEAKYHNQNKLSPALIYYHQKLQPAYSLQVVIDMDYVDKSCFYFGKTNDCSCQNIFITIDLENGLLRHCEGAVGDRSNLYITIWIAAFVEMTKDDNEVSTLVMAQEALTFALLARRKSIATPFIGIVAGAAFDFNRSSH